MRLTNPSTPHNRSGDSLSPPSDLVLTGDDRRPIEEKPPQSPSGMGRGHSCPPGLIGKSIADKNVRAPKTVRLPAWRTFLNLGRWSHLPTVWSNCLAGWLLNGGNHPGNLLLLCLGATCLYLGGTFLQHACDASYDALRYQDRPIPAGIMESQTALLLSLGWFALGAILLASLGKITAMLAILLLAMIVLYDLAHRVVIFAPVLLGLCRFLLYLVAGAATGHGISGLTIWCALALLAFVIGFGCLSRHVDTPFGLPYLPVLLLATPLALAWFANAGIYRLPASLCSAALALWLFWCLRPVLGFTQRNIPRAAAGLLAGIVLVDLVAVAGGAMFFWAFLWCFFSVLLFQRFQPGS